MGVTLQVATEIVGQLSVAAEPGAARTAQDLTKALQSTNLLLSKMIRQLARQDESAGSWSSYRLLQEKLLEIVETVRASM